MHQVRRQVRGSPQLHYNLEWIPVQRIGETFSCTPFLSLLLTQSDTEPARSVVISLATHSHYVSVKRITSAIDAIICYESENGKNIQPESYVNNLSE